MEDWPKELVVLVEVKEVLAQLDKEKLWPYHLPQVGASEEEVAACEGRLGFQLDHKYRTFLKYANGWRGFYQTVDLFGTAELSGSEHMKRAWLMVSAVRSVLEQGGVRLADVLPIATTMVDKDVFVITTARSPMPGIVIWIAGEEIDRFPHFDEFYLAMVDYNRNEVDRFARMHGN